MFKLKAGDICKLNVLVHSTYACDNWFPGRYWVVRISHSPGTCRSDFGNPKCQSYQFEKIRKDGTAYKNFCNGYDCFAWDRFINDGKVSI